MALSHPTEKNVVLNRISKNHHPNSLAAPFKLTYFKIKYDSFQYIRRKTYLETFIKDKKNLYNASKYCFTVIINVLN